MVCDCGAADMEGGASEASGAHAVGMEGRVSEVSGAHTAGMEGRVRPPLHTGAPDSGHAK